MSKRDADAELYAKLTPVEKMELYQTNRARWEEIHEAHEAEGIAKLMNKRLVL